jgi:hypothetical protein
LLVGPSSNHVAGLHPATQTQSLAQASDPVGWETMHAWICFTRAWTVQRWLNYLHAVYMLICRFKRIWRRTHLVSRKTEDDDNSDLAFFLLFWTFSLGFFLCFCFFSFIPLPLVPKVKGQQRWRLVAVGFFLLLFVCSSVTVSLCCLVLLHVSLCFFLFSLFSFSPSLSRLSPWRWNLLLAVADEDDSVEGLFQHCFLSVFFYSLLPFFTLPPRFSFCLSVSPPYPLPPSVSSFFPCFPPFIRLFLLLL